MYKQRIREELARLGAIGVDPRHVEGWMRVEHGTLDHLGEGRFAAEVQMSVACIEEAGTRESEQLARSYGL